MRYEYFYSGETPFEICFKNCGCEDCATDFVCYPHIRCYYLIHYVVRGSGYFETDNTKHRVCAGDVFIIYPNVTVTYYVDKGTDWSLCWIGFSDADTKTGRQYLSYLGIEIDTFTLSPNSGFYDENTKCYEYCRSAEKNTSLFMLNGFLYKCLSYLGTYKGSNKYFCYTYSLGDEEYRLLRENIQSGYTIMAIEYIKNNYMNDISVSDIARYLSIDRTYLFRIFKPNTGYSPVQFLLRYKIDRAKDLIALGRYSITQISAYVGIHDIYYFSKTFKKVTGITPAVYRKKVL